MKYSLGYKINRALNMYSSGALVNLRSYFFDINVYTLRALVVTSLSNPDIEFRIRLLLAGFVFNPQSHDEHDLAYIPSRLNGTEVF